MASVDTTLGETARDGFERRGMPVRQLADNATAVAVACRDMAERFEAGGRLLVFGAGGAATDAEHVAVEFVHPVIVGKRALPALSLASDAATLTGIGRDYGGEEIFSRQLATVGRSADIALGMCDHRDDGAVRRGLETARDSGMLTVALLGSAAAELADTAVANHYFVTDSADPYVVKESNVTTYHVLWELVHVFLDAPRGGSDRADDAAAPPGGVEALYPFLYGGSQPEAALLDSVAASTLDKVAEVVALRAETGQRLADRLAEAAAAMATRFAAGATLWSFGNGGSSTDAQQVARAFSGPTPPHRPLPARCLTSDAAILTALSNDVGYDVVFARQVKAYARAGDIVLGLSTSGGSPNVLNGFDAAKALGLTTIGIAGYGGGRMAESASIDFLFDVDSASVHRVQEVQTTIYHLLAELTRIALPPPLPDPG